MCSELAHVIYVSCFITLVKGTCSEHQSSLVFKTIVGLFRERTFDRISRLKQPLKWPTPVDHLFSNQSIFNGVLFLVTEYLVYSEMRHMTVLKWDLCCFTLTLMVDCKLTVKSV